MATEQAPNDLDPRLAAAEAALEEAYAERNRLWEELNRVKAKQRDEEHYRFLYESVVTSTSWRLTRPLRTAKWIVRELPRRGRRFFSSRPRS